MKTTHIPGALLGSWRMSENVCALADSERHLGHIQRFGTEWLACDGTHLSESGCGFRVLGSYPDIHSAMNAVELATIRMPLAA